MSDYGVPPIERLLSAVGELNGKADGILRELEDIKQDNIRCHADRDNIYLAIGKVQNKQYWMVGVATGLSIILGKVLNGFGFTTIGH